jgi:hypothetical protein
MSHILKNNTSYILILTGHSLTPEKSHPSASASSSSELKNNPPQQTGSLSTKIFALNVLHTLKKHFVHTCIS